MERLFQHIGEPESRGGNTGDKVIELWNTPNGYIVKEYLLITGKYDEFKGEKRIKTTIKFDQYDEYYKMKQTSDRETKLLSILTKVNIHDESEAD